MSLAANDNLFILIDSLTLIAWLTLIVRPPKLNDEIMKKIARIWLHISLKDCAKSTLIYSKILSKTFNTTVKLMLEKKMYSSKSHWTIL